MLFRQHHLVIVCPIWIEGPISFPPCSIVLLDSVSFNKSLGLFNRRWFFFHICLPWLIWRPHHDLVFNESRWPMEKVHQMNWGSLQDVGKFEWEKILHLEKTLDVTYHDVLNEFDLVMLH